MLNYLVVFYRDGLKLDGVELLVAVLNRDLDKHTIFELHHSADLLSNLHCIALSTDSTHKAEIESPRSRFIVIIITNWLEFEGRAV